YLGIRERTRSHAKGASSTAAGIDVAVVRKEEQGPVRLLGGGQCGAGIRCPADFVITPLRSGGLYLANLSLDGFDESVVGQKAVGCKQSQPEQSQGGFVSHPRIPLTKYKGSVGRLFKPVEINGTSANPSDLGPIPPYPSHTA